MLRSSVSSRCGKSAKQLTGLLQITSSRTYLLWIEYSPTEVTAWYCKCRAGARVVGVCSHIASILWYYARHKPHYSWLRKIMRFMPCISKVPQDGRDVRAYSNNSCSCSTFARNWGEYLEDASHVIDDTDSDQSVIEEWDPTILLETPYNIIMIL
jgi:hypothetical protein